MYNMWVPIVYGGQKKVLEPLNLELQPVMSCQVGAGNRLLQSSIRVARTQALSHLSSPMSLSYCGLHCKSNIKSAEVSFPVIQ